MLKNKSSEINTELIVRILVMIALFVVLFIACNKIKATVFNSEKEYMESFENFVDGINEMKRPVETFSISIEEKSALVGFSKDSTKWECYNCYGDKVIFERPPYAEASKAYICLCRELGFDEENGVKSVKCKKLTCEESNHDLVNKIIIKDGKQWNNGFLFANGISGINGLDKYEQNILTLYAEKQDNLIGVCSLDILNYHKKKFGDDSCITK